MADIRLLLPCVCAPFSANLFKRFFFFGKSSSIFISTPMKRKIFPKFLKINRLCWWMLTFILVIFSCIKRNNPYDPLIYNPIKQYQDSLSRARQKAQSEIDSLIRVADSLGALAKSADTQLTKESALADSVKAKNALIVRNNANLRVKNAIIDTLQKKTCSSVKSVLDTMRVVDTARLSTNVVQDGESANAIYLSAESMAIKLNAQFFPDTVISNGELDSLESISNAAVAYFQALQKKRDSTNAILDSTNAAFSKANTAWADSNQSILSFNALVQTTYPCSFSLTTPDTILKSISLLKPGDSLFIAPGAFTFNTVLTLGGISGTPSSHIVIIGDPQGNTVFTSSPTQNSSLLHINNNTHYVDIINITFSQGPSDGVLMEEFSGNILFQNCAFTGNHGNGIKVQDSDIKLRNCRFLYNDSNGVLVQNSNADVQNILVAGNQKNGILFAGLGFNNMFDTALIVSATISDNDSDGVFQRGQYSNVSINKSLITFNRRIGVHREFEVSAASPLSLSVTDLYANIQQNLVSLAPFDSLSYFSVDPQYVDKSNYNYSIGPGSAVADSLGFQNQ